MAFRQSLTPPKFPSIRYVELEWRFKALWRTWLGKNQWFTGGQPDNVGNLRTITIVTRFYKTDPNRTLAKIKLTPPVDSYTIILVVLTLGTNQTTQGWFQQTSFLGSV